MIYLTGLLAVLGGLAALGWWLEAREWNDGRCACCGGRWIYFDTDSQGGRGYRAVCGRYTWISWPMEAR